MYKNLLVHVPTERSPRPAIDGSISLAMDCGAHLDAVAAGYESSSVPFVTEGGAAVASIMEVERERALERAEAALRVFEVEAKGARIAYDTRAVAGTFGEIVTTVGSMARLYDLTVVSQGEPDRDTLDNQLPQELLMEAGGPMLFMPCNFRGVFKATRIGICWNGSRLAARALHDAMPLLAKADTLTAITLNSADVPREASAAHLARLMARADLPIRTVMLQVDRGNVQSSLLSIAADEGLDLLVMGGYDHSRLQEALFGGVTRAMFRSMTVPVLMSH